MNDKHWKSIPPDLKYGIYRVLFEGRYEGRATLSSVGWTIVEDSVHRDPKTNIVAYKDLEPNLDRQKVIQK